MHCVNLKRQSWPGLTELARTIILAVLLRCMVFNVQHWDERRAVKESCYYGEYRTSETETGSSKQKQKKGRVKRNKLLNNNTATSHLKLTELIISVLAGKRSLHTVQNRLNHLNRLNQSENAILTPGAWWRAATCPPTSYLMTLASRHSHSDTEDHKNFKHKMIINNIIRMK